MVRRSSSTSSGTTYWFLIFVSCCSCILDVSLAHAQVFRVKILIKITKTKCDKEGDEINPGSMQPSLWRRIEGREYPRLEVE